MLIMSKQEERRMYAQQGKNHAEKGIDCPPSDRLTEVILRSLTSDTSIEEADKAYYDGMKNND